MKPIQLSTSIFVRRLLLRRELLALLAVAVGIVCTGPVASASIVGTTYDAILQADVWGGLPVGFEYDTERHDASVMVDGLPAPFPGELVYDEPSLAEPYDLEIEESITPVSPHAEWIDFKVSNPAGGSLWANPLDPLGSVFFELNLYWDDFDGVVEVVDLLMHQGVHNSPPIPVYGYSTMVSGSGTQNDPLQICYELPGYIVSLADNLVFGVDVRHCDVPEPGTAGLALLALAGTIWRKRSPAGR